MRNIYLVGFMGAGKTAVGGAVARRLGRDFVDLDQRLEEHFGMTIREVFASRGEAAFRRAERAELAAATGQSGLVVATGGGTFSSTENRRLIDASGGLSVFLDVPWEVIVSRLAGDTASRPKWVDATDARRLYERRLESYRTASIHLELAGDERAEAIAAQIEDVAPERACAS
ncbi:MAG: shikimate kinase [Holophagae bacterium]